MPVTSSEIAATHPTDRFKWSIPVCAVIAVSIAFIAIEFTSSWDFGGFFFLFFTTPIVTICLLIVGIIKAIQRRWLTSLSFLVAILAYGAASFLLFANSSTMRSRIVWTFHAKQYKTAVLNQPSSNGLKHIEWLGWGFAGADTTMYLAYDPANSLAHKDAHTGKYGSLHCDEVWKVRLLEDKWYAITFYTNEVWDDSCNTAAPSP